MGVFVDQTGRIWTAYNNARLDSLVYKFPPSSGYFDGLGTTSILTSYSVDLDLYALDSTMDFWLQTTQVGLYCMVIYQGNAMPNFDTNTVWIEIVNGILRWSPDLPSYPANHWLQSLAIVNDGSWHHCACVRYGDDFTLYVDGVSQGYVTLASYSNPQYPSPYPLTIGNVQTYDYPHSGGYPYVGYVDEFRFTKGLARWTANFTPPTVPYTVDPYTKSLLHFGETVSPNTGSFLPFFLNH